MMYQSIGFQRMNIASIIIESTGGKMKFIKYYYTQVLKKKYKCPHCGEYSINLLNKMTLDMRYSKKL